MMPGVSFLHACSRRAGEIQAGWNVSDDSYRTAQMDVSGSSAKAGKRSQASRSLAAFRDRFTRGGRLGMTAKTFILVSSYV